MSDQLDRISLNISLSDSVWRLTNLSILIGSVLRAFWGFIKCSEKCARRDWLERALYISIKHAPYVTRVRCWDIMQAAYVIGTHVRNSQYIL